MIEKTMNEKYFSSVIPQPGENAGPARRQQAVGQEGAVGGEVGAQGRFVRHNFRDVQIQERADADPGQAYADHRPEAGRRHRQDGGADDGPAQRGRQSNQSIENTGNDSNDQASVKDNQVSLKDMMLDL